jgi:crotonobetainyl-CoA:carnitine CoA-transferase CaiB-like acyl-CoA transferase
VEGSHESDAEVPRGPLTGIRVLDFTQAMAGPDCSMLLADFGADVVKVEPEGGEGSRTWGTARFGDDDGFSGLYLAFNRNKASITLDLKSDGGQELAVRLIRESDVVLESFKPGVAERLGIGYEQAAALRPDIVYCSISGFGQTGPMRERPGYDQLLQAYAGHMSITGEPGRPSVRIGPSAIDLLTGAHAAFGIMLALRERDRSGRGQWVETSLYDSSLHLVSHFLADYSGSGRLQPKVGAGFPFLAPYGNYQASDREFFMGVGSDRMFERLSIAIERADLVSDARFATNADRIANRDVLDEQLTPLFRAEPAERWVELCTELDIPTALVSTIAELADQEQARAREMIVETGIDGVRTAGLPIKLSRTPAAIHRPPPALGEDNERVRAKHREEPAGDAPRTPA